MTSIGLRLWYAAWGLTFLVMHAASVWFFPCRELPWLSVGSAAVFCLVTGVAGHLTVIVWQRAQWTLALRSVVMVSVVLPALGVHYYSLFMFLFSHMC